MKHDQCRMLPVSLSDEGILWIYSCIYHYFLHKMHSNIKSRSGFTIIIYYLLSIKVLI